MKARGPEAWTTIRDGDVRTASAFATLWNNLPLGSVYTREQLEEVLLPLTGWLESYTSIEPDSTNILQRNGNSWKFGGRRPGAAPGDDPEEL